MPSILSHSIDLHSRRNVSRMGNRGTASSLRSLRSNRQSIRRDRLGRLALRQNDLHGNFSSRTPSQFGNDSLTTYSSSRSSSFRGSESADLAPVEVPTIKSREDYGYFVDIHEDEEESWVGSFLDTHAEKQRQAKREELDDL